MKADEFLTERYENDLNSYQDNVEALEIFAKAKVLEELEIVLQHPTKTGYKRSDVVKRIAEIEKNGRL